METSTTSVRVNTCSDAGKESVWGAPSHGSKHRNNKLHARRLNTMVSLRAEHGGAKLPAQDCRLDSSQPAPQWMNLEEKAQPTISSKNFCCIPQRWSMRILTPALRLAAEAYCFVLLCLVFQYCFLCIEFMCKQDWENCLCSSLWERVGPLYSIIGQTVS